MILSRYDLQKAIDSGEIVFDPPLVGGQLGQASIDLRLGYKFIKLLRSEEITVAIRRGFDPLAGRGLWVEKELPRGTDEFGKRANYVIEPTEFVLAQTLERITIPNHLIAMVEGRSSYARAGLSMHQTAPWIQPGWNGQITLEIRNSGPWKIELIPEEDKPCQLTFMRLTKPLDKEQTYGIRPSDQFQNQTTLLPNRQP